MIEIQVRKKAAVNLTPEEVIVCGNSDYGVVFLFDEEWASKEVKTARFVYRKGGKNYYEDVVFTGTAVKVPVLSNINYVLVGVYAGELITTTPAVIECSKSILCGSGMRKEPTPDVYNQLVALIESGMVGCIAKVEQTEIGAVITMEDKNGKTTATVRHGGSGVFYAHFSAIGQSADRELLHLEERYEQVLEAYESGVEVKAMFNYEVYDLRAVDDGIMLFSNTAYHNYGGKETPRIREIYYEDGGECYHVEKTLATTWIDLGKFDSYEDVYNKMDDLKEEGLYRISDDEFTYSLRVEKVGEFVAQYMWNTEEGPQNVFSRFNQFVGGVWMWSNWVLPNSSNSGSGSSDGASVFRVNAYQEDEFVDGRAPFAIDCSMQEIEEALHSGKAVKCAIRTFGIELDLVRKAENYIHFAAVLTEEYGSGKHYIYDLFVDVEDTAELCLTEMGGNSQELERIDLGYFDSTEEVFNKMDELTTTGKYRLMDDAYIYLLDVERATGGQTDYAAQYYWNTDEGGNKVYCRSIDYKKTDPVWSNWELHNPANDASVFYVDMQYQILEDIGYADCDSNKTFTEIKAAYKSGKVIKARVNDRFDNNIILNLVRVDDYLAHFSVTGSQEDGAHSYHDIYDLYIMDDGDGVTVGELYVNKDVDTNDVYYVNVTTEYDPYESGYADCITNKTMNSIRTAWESGSVVKARLDGIIDLDMVWHDDRFTFTGIVGKEYTGLDKNYIFDLIIIGDRVAELYLTEIGNSSGGGSGGSSGLKLIAEQEITTEDEVSLIEFDGLEKYDEAMMIVYAPWNGTGSCIATMLINGVQVEKDWYEFQTSNVDHLNTFHIKKIDSFLYEVEGYQCQKSTRYGQEILVKGTYYSEDLTTGISKIAFSLSAPLITGGYNRNCWVRFYAR